MKRVLTCTGTLTVWLLTLAMTLALGGRQGTVDPCYAQEQAKAVAKVNGVAITETELDQAIDTYMPPGSFHGNMAGQKRDQYRKPALDMLIERELIYQEARRRGINPTDKEVDKALGEIRKQFKDKKTFEKALKQSGMTLEEYRMIIKRNVTIDTLVKAEVEDKSKFSDKELESYYKANKTKFLKPEAVKVRHILVKVAAPGEDKEKKDAKEKASSLLKKVKAGEDFAVLAQKNSDDDYRVKGGDLGWVHRDRLEPAIEEAAFSMKIGESTVVETQYGFHIIMVEDKKAPEQLGYAEVKNLLKKDLESKKQDEYRQALTKGLKDNAKIEIAEQ